MAVRNWCKAGKTRGIPRRPFVGDPAAMGVEHNPAPITKRGYRRSDETREYLDNLNTRHRQTCPGKGATRPVYAGPSKRSKDCNNSAWRDAMSNPKAYEWTEGVPARV